MDGDRSRILVVADQSDALLFLFDVLSAEGYFVEGSSSALDALGYLRRRPYDAILADACLPEMDGLELLDRIKELRPGTRVILMGGGAEGVREDSHRRGAEGMLVKPFRKEELLRVLGRALGASAGGALGVRKVPR